MQVQKLSSSASNNYQQLLSYYKDKVDMLQKQRQAWLSKMDECASRIQQKQQKQQKLRQTKAKYGEIQNNIIHHTIARFDEQLSTINIDKQNQNLEFQEAEQLIKMRELAEEFPLFAEKCLPCIATIGEEIINNDLNLHNQGNNSRYGKLANKYQFYNSKKNGDQKNKGSNSQKNFIKGQNNKNAYGDQSHRTKKDSKKTLEQIMKMQIIQTQKLNAKQIAVMEEQQKILQQSIVSLKKRRDLKGLKEKDIIKQFKKKRNQLQKKHKELAENYFSLRRQFKDKNNHTSEQNTKLKKTFQGLQAKIEVVVRNYEKQNKAKQALIMRKSQDFQQDYKAKMRAKQRNLQSLKQNYEKMQQLCIQKVRKLQATVEKAKYQLQDTQQRRKFIVEDLRQQLKNLEKRVNQQRIQKAKIDLKIKQKVLQQKQREEFQQQQQEKQKKARERQQLIKTAYIKTSLPTKNIKNQSRAQKKQLLNKNKDSFNEKQNSNKKKENRKNANNAQSSGQDDSLEISDLDNIRKQITQLEKKIAKGEEEAA